MASAWHQFGIACATCSKLKQWDHEMLAVVQAACQAKRGRFDAHPSPLDEALDSHVARSVE